MKLHITPEKFEELIKKSYSLDIIYLLKLIEAEYDVVPLYEDSMRLSAILHLSCSLSCHAAPLEAHASLAACLAPPRGPDAALALPFL